MMEGCVLFGDGPLTVQVEVDHWDKCQEECFSPEQARDLSMRVSTAVSPKIIVDRDQDLLAESGNDGHGPQQLFLIADMQEAFHPIAGQGGVHRLPQRAAFSGIRHHRSVRHDARRRNPSASAARCHLD
jgi:hypothetical protein